MGKTAREGGVEVERGSKRKAQKKPNFIYKLQIDGVVEG